MEKEFGSGYDQRLLSSTLNLSGFPFMNGYLNTSTDPVHGYPYPVEDSTLRNLLSILHSGFQQPKAGEPNWLQNWFYHNPRQYLHQTFAPLSNSAPEQKLPATGAIPSEKRFLIFDHSGDKTTLLYSSGAHTPLHFGACRAPNPPTVCNLGKEAASDSYYYPLRPSLNDENVEQNSRDITEGDMHGNTEELDALLCSDDDSDFSEDEETSTGHSPSTMTDNGFPKPVKETGEEVDSFSTPTKRRKLDALSSLKTFACSELERDAESSCGGRSDWSMEELYPVVGCKRSRREKIHKTLSMLQSIIPDADGKDAMVVIDQAIHYLRSLKMKAKALGINSI